MSLLTAYVTEQAPISVIYPETRRSPAVPAFAALAVDLVPPRLAWDEAAAARP